MNYSEKFQLVFKKEGTGHDGVKTRHVELRAEQDFLT